jgi:hypothetical protein
MAPIKALHQTGHASEALLKSLSRLREPAVEFGVRPRRARDDMACCRTPHNRPRVLRRGRGGLSREATDAGTGADNR